MNTAHRTQSHAKRNFTHHTAWAGTIAMAMPPKEQQADTVMVRIRTAFELLKTGHGTAADYNRVAAAFNIGMIRAEEIDPLAEQTMLTGMDALRECDAIQQRHGRYGFTGPGLTAVSDAVELYEGILRMSSPLQMEAAQNEAARRMLVQMRGAV